jgi:hypothetical protein
VGEDRIQAKEIVMPPLTTPSAALAFMVLFFAAIMGVPLFFVRHHHRLPR